jgi:centrosomal protein CEP110
MKPKFDKLSASVKGHLTRRLLATEKIQIIVQTIRDTVELLLKLYEENSSVGIIKEEDLGLHNRLIQQLTGACSSFHDIFFKISIKERMAIIANDREKVKAKAAKNLLVTRRLNPSPSKRNMSSATLKSLERRQTQ